MRLAAFKGSKQVVIMAYTAKNATHLLEVVESGFLSRVECQMSRVRCRGSRVKSRGSRVKSRG